MPKRQKEEVLDELEKEAPDDVEERSFALRQNAKIKELLEGFKKEMEGLLEPLSPKTRADSLKEIKQELQAQVKVLVAKLFLAKVEAAKNLVESSK